MHSYLNHQVILTYMLLLIQNQQAKSRKTWRFAVSFDHNWIVLISILNYKNTYRESMPTITMTCAGVVSTSNRVDNSSQIVLIIHFPMQFIDVSSWQTGTEVWHSTQRFTSHEIIIIINIWTQSLHSPHQNLLQVHH